MPTPLSKPFVSLGLASMVMVACGNQAMMDVGFMNSEAAGASKLFTKSMEIRDTSGENKVYLTLKSKSEELLQAYTPEVFELTVLFERSPLSFLEEDEPSELLEHLQMPESADAPFVEYEVGASSLVPEAMGFRLEENLPAGHQPFFMWRYSYSYDDSFKVQRDSFWNRVYFKAWYQETPDSDWLPWLPEQHLGGKDSFQRSMPSSHQIKIGIKARKAAHYELEFFNPEDTFLGPVGLQK